MAVRKDGMNTKIKLLTAAAEVFAEKGYQHTTVAEIGQRADSNLAAVNYHFGSKDALYVAVWKHAFEEAMEVYPPDGGLDPQADPQEKLQALINSHIHRILDDSRLGYAGKILLQEMSNPTEAIHQVRHDAIQPLLKRTQSIIKELLGSEATDQEVVFCEMSVIHQCLAIGFRKGRFPDHTMKEKFTPDVIGTLVEHITRFSLAGISAVRTNIESRNLQRHL